jgi:hypothetical protein
MPTKMPPLPVGTRVAGIKIWRVNREWCHWPNARVGEIVEVNHDTEHGYLVHFPILNRTIAMSRIEIWRVQ